MDSLLRRGLLVAVALTAGSAIAAELETEEQKLGYIIGMDIGNSLRREGTAVDIDALLEAIRTVYEGGEAAMTAEEAQVVREAFIAKRKAAAEAEAAAQAERNAALAETNKAEGEAFLAENATKEGVIVTESGLQYKVLTMGDGEKPAANDTIEVHYRGTFLDGTEFDSSYKNDQPFNWPLGRMIPGWIEGIQLMPAGSKFMFYIKPELAYGDGGGRMPPNSTLIFEVELLGFEPEAE